jgi:hypothetical protein
MFENCVKKVHGKYGAFGTTEKKFPQKIEVYLLYFIEI